MDKQNNRNLLYGNPGEKEIEDQQPYAFWLHRVEKLGNAGMERLLKQFGTPRELYCAKKNSLEKVLEEKQLIDILQTRTGDIYQEYDAMLEKGISFYPFYHEAYPKHLLEIPDRPFGIYVKGRLPRDHQRSVAIIGARNCSEYGRYVAEQFAGEFAAEGINIISGMARGIDGIAQKAALERGGKTYAVLGCGSDICYPPSHESLYQEICEKGGILSIYPPGTIPLPRRFPPRNRIISGLSDAVVVIEARQKSGTLITVDMALEQGREVYVVPGRITDRLSDGCNELLRQGAGIALSPARVLRELSETVWSGIGKGREEKESTGEEGSKEKWKETGSTKGMSEQEKALLYLLDLYPVSIDQIRIMMQTNKILSPLTLPQTMELLVKLTIEGFVKNTGGYYGLAKPL